MTAAAKLAGVGGAVAGSWYLHRIGRRSGATCAELTQRLPGDDIVPRPRWESTRAITIAAAPEHVWPWIVQMGFPTYRAGWYTPEWLDRLMWGIQARSADSIRQDLQELRVGDRVPDSADFSVYYTVAEVVPPRALVLHSTRHRLGPLRSMEFSWAFVLTEHGPGETRLLIRARAVYAPRRSWPLVELLIGPGDYVNAGAMLRGIKARAEAGP